MEGFRRDSHKYGVQFDKLKNIADIKIILYRMWKQLILTLFYFENDSVLTLYSNLPF